jgi:lipoyl(octanoyl) transferase
MNIEVKNSQKAVDYTESMKILEQRVDDVLSGKKRELLWVLEHKNVYTAGTSANKFDQIDKKIKVIKTNRGGKHTYHGPGQKVVYFVLNLNKRGKNIRKLLNNIEECIIAVLKDYGINSHSDRKNIGIWIKKIISCIKLLLLELKLESG